MKEPTVFVPGPLWAYGRLAEGHRGQRMTISLSLDVLGTDANGDQFTEKALTLSVGPNWATIALKRTLGPRQYLQLRRPRVNRQVPARIIGQVGIHPEGNVYGMAFTGGAFDFLGIQFPPQADAGTKHKPVWLQCNACGAVEDVKLDELETFVLKANDALGHPCTLCNDWTLWGKSDGKENVKPGHTARVSVPAALPTGGERRKHRRVQLQRITAVRHPLLAEEIVSTTNISRGGLRFLSPREYQPNEWIEIALFYQPGGHNTYAPGRIVWQATDGDLRAYGLQYVRS